VSRQEVRDQGEGSKQEAVFQKKGEHDEIVDETNRHHRQSNRSRLVSSGNCETECNNTSKNTGVSGRDDDRSPHRR
jgi:hypothetical protein